MRLFSVCGLIGLNKEGIDRLSLDVLAECDGIGLDEIVVGGVMVDRAHGCCHRPIATGRSPHAALWARAGRVGAAILAMSDTQVSVVRLVLHAFDSLDRVRNVGEVDERAVPDNNIHQRQSADQIRKHLLLLQEIDKLDLAELAEIPLKLLLVKCVEILDVANIDVTRSTRVHGQGQSRGKGAGVLAPADLQPAVVERKALVRRDLEECQRSSGVDESNELGREFNR